MSDLKSDESLDARIKTLETEIAADTAAAQAKEAEERAAAMARSNLWTRIAKKKAALEELIATWTARGLPPRTEK